MPNQFNEPWQVDQEDGYSILFDEGKRPDLEQVTLRISMSAEGRALDYDGYLERIVACVNACAGIPTDELISLGMPDSWVRTTQADEFSNPIRSIVRSEGLSITKDYLRSQDASSHVPHPTPDPEATQ